MPAKKKGGTTDDAAAKMASYMLPVPAPSSMRAWSGAQSLQDDAQMPDLEGYVPVGDLLRDYVFMCKGMGVSPHPCIVNRIRRPMSEHAARSLVATLTGHADHDAVPAYRVCLLPLR